MHRLGFALLGVLASMSLAQVAPRLKDFDKIEWMMSGSLPPGAEYHLIYEDKKTSAVQTLVRFPSDYTLPPHSHTFDETILVIKGKLVVTVGGEETTLRPGSYAVFPAGTSHTLRAKGRCDMLVALNGPYDVKGLPPVR